MKIIYKDGTEETFDFENYNIDTEVGLLEIQDADENERVLVAMSEIKKIELK